MHSAWRCRLILLYSEDDLEKVLSQYTKTKQSSIGVFFSSSASPPMTSSQSRSVQPESLIIAKKPPTGKSLSSRKPAPLATTSQTQPMANQSTDDFAPARKTSAPVAWKETVPVDVNVVEDVPVVPERRKEPTSTAQQTARPPCKFGTDQAPLLLPPPPPPPPPPDSPVPPVQHCLAQPSSIEHCPVTRGKTNPPKPGSIRIRRGSVRIFEDPWIRGSDPKKEKKSKLASPAAGMHAYMYDVPRPRQLRAWTLRDRLRPSQQHASCASLL